MKTAITALLMLFAVAARADDLLQYQMDVGNTTYQTRGNGVWYQVGFPYNLELQNTSVSVGLVVNPTDWLRLHADLTYLGRASANSTDTPSDANYNPTTHSCNGQCWHLANYSGSWQNYGVALTVEPHIKRDGWDFGALIGPYLYWAPGQEVVSEWTATPNDVPHTITAGDTNKMQYGAVVGLTASRGPISISIKHYVLNGQSGPFPPIFKSANVVSITYKF